MEELKSCSSERDLPEYLYHYTSIEGLEGILSRRCLWASQIHFLNDTQEFRYSVQILKHVLSELGKEYPIRQRYLASEPGEMLGEFYRGLNHQVLYDMFERVPICVFSLTEKGDLLGQWRGYCPPDGGYSIRFQTKLLLSLLNAQNLSLAHCIYDESEQEGSIRRAVIEKGEVLLEMLTSRQEEIDKIRTKCALDFFMTFSKIASTVKHPSFHEECEWRIVSAPIANKDMQFRIKKSILIPYLPISFKDADPLLIDEIIIGPAPEQRLAEWSLIQFKIKNAPNASITASSTPYREL